MDLFTPRALIIAGVRFFSPGESDYQGRVRRPGGWRALAPDLGSRRARLRGQLCAVSQAAVPFPGCGPYVRPDRRERIAEYWLPENGIADDPHQMSDFRLALSGPHDHGG